MLIGLVRHGQLAYFLKPCMTDGQIQGLLNQYVTQALQLHFEHLIPF